MITRRPGERIVVGDDVVIHVVDVGHGQVRVGIEAPKSVPVYREEIWTAIKAENEAAAHAPAGPLPKVEAPTTVTQ